MSRQYTAILVDDEYLAREELKDLLADFPAVRVVGEAASVAEAVEAVGRLEPDVVFLDIQMPRESGFDLLARVEPAFKTVFVTAHDGFAVRAFEVNALDYLLKPVNPERLARTVARITGAEPEARPKRLAYDDRVFVATARRQEFVKVSAIKFVNAAGNYSTLTTTDRRELLVLKSIGEWEERLPEADFVRIHRSTIVNLDYVERVEKWASGSAQVVFMKGETEPLQVSRRNASRLRDMGA